MTEKGWGDQSEMRHGSASAFLSPADQPKKWSAAASRHGFGRPDPAKPAPPALARPDYLLIAAALFALTAIALWLLGRPVICPCGTVRLWSGAVAGAENSQHLADWYSALHVVFGMLIFLVMWRTSRHWPTGWLLIVAIASASLWEIAENTPWTIARFGQGGAGALYGGDSIVNAMGDMLFMLGGFVLAMTLPARWSVALALAIELGVALAIRDSLALGALMLLHPFHAIAQWQLSAAFPALLLAMPDPGA
jgi:hypothetical protein